MKFFHFSQNNSFGQFEGPHNLVVEAESATDANERAQFDDWGIYFNGVELGLDCPCCGDRWYELWEGESGKDFPHCYEEPLSLVDFQTNTLVLFADGTKKYGTHE